jgi:hypothetical protein
VGNVAKFEHLCFEELSVRSGSRVVYRASHDLRAQKVLQSVRIRQSCIPHLCNHGLLIVAIGLGCGARRLSEQNHGDSE